MQNIDIILTYREFSGLEGALPKTRSPSCPGRIAEPGCAIFRVSFLRSVVWTRDGEFRVAAPPARLVLVARKWQVSRPAQNARVEFLCGLVALAAPGRHQAGSKNERRREKTRVELAKLEAGGRARSPAQQQRIFSWATTHFLSTRYQKIRGNTGKNHTVAWRVITQTCSVR